MTTATFELLSPFEEEVLGIVLDEGPIEYDPKSPDSYSLAMVFGYDNSYLSALGRALRTLAKAGHLVIRDRKGVNVLRGRKNPHVPSHIYISIRAACHD